MLLECESCMKSLVLPSAGAIVCLYSTHVPGWGRAVETAVKHTVHVGSQEQKGALLDTEMYALTIKQFAFSIQIPKCCFGKISGAATFHL